MIRLVVLWWLARRMDGLLANEKLAGRWHLAVTALTVVEAVGEVLYHLGGYASHERARKVSGRSSCQHVPRRTS